MSKHIDIKQNLNSRNRYNLAHEKCISKYVSAKRNLDLRTKKNESAIISHLKRQVICRCPEAEDGEHECSAITAREHLDEIINKRHTTLSH
jgi:hypothetical protein